MDPVKSPSDKRDYRCFELPNGLKVCVCHDAEADRAAAAMSVAVGSLSDPEHLPGLAHFLEHMLFLGTERFPEENDYSGFLSKHAGMANAYTTDTFTNYYLTVGHAHLAGALDRFSQFFISPLFDADCTEREVNAVDSEHAKNLESDFWRLNQVNRSTSKPLHPYCHFSTGNKETLWTIPHRDGIEIREEVISFYKQHYSSNLMGLGIVGRQSLDELEKMVRERFADIPNYNRQPLVITDHPHGPEQNGKLLQVVPVTDMRKLTLSFAMNDQRHLFHTKPGHYVSHLIGHEAAGSLLSYLKNKGWASSLSAGDYAAVYKGYGFFKINVDLSTEGLAKIDDVIAAVFQYIEMLRKEGPQKWIFDECAQLLDMAWQFVDKPRPESFCLQAAQDLHHYPADLVLKHPFVMDKFDEDAIQAVLDKLRPQNMRVTVVAKDFEQTVDRQEPVYGTKYSVRDLTQREIERFANPGTNGELHLPHPNQLIPTDFELRELPAAAPKLPVLVVDEPLISIYHKQDDTFETPKAVIKIRILSPATDVDARHSVMSWLLVSIVLHAINEYMYDAMLGGIDVNIRTVLRGFEISLAGFHHKQPTLLREIFRHFATADVTEETFAILCDRYKRETQKVLQDIPVRVASRQLETCTLERVYQPQDKLAVIDDITHAQVLQHRQQVLSRLHLRALIHGNLTRAEVEGISGELKSMCQQLCSSQPSSATEREPVRHVDLPIGQSYFHMMTTPYHKIHACIVYFQTGVDTQDIGVRTQLCNQILAESFFDTLRTKEQLGYIVHSRPRIQSNSQGIMFYVQSDREPRFLETRIDEFLKSSLESLKNMDDEEFEKHKDSVASRLEEKPKRLSEESAPYWAEIVSQLLVFDRALKEAAAVRQLTKQDMVSFFDQALLDTNSRRKLVIGVIGTKDGESVAPEERIISTAHEITSPQAFRSGLPLLPVGNLNMNKFHGSRK